jgi:hypothetical protein
MSGGHDETTTTPTMVLGARSACLDCGRVFDLLDDTDADEWTYGHDCEA